MKKYVSVIAVIMLCVFVAMGVAACTPDTVPVDELVVYNWADYIYDYEDDFKEYYKDITGREINVTYVTFDTNETMLTKLVNGDAKVDVVCPSEYAIQKLLESDSLVKLDYFDEAAYTNNMTINDKYTHNSGNVDAHILDKVDATFGNIVTNSGQTVKMSDYFVPYMYGTLGILYNKYEFIANNIYDEQILNKANWGILFNDDGSGNILSEALTGNILMKDSIRDTYAATVFYLKERGLLDGKSTPDGVKYTDLSANQLINQVDDTILDLCREVLTDQKSQLFGYEVDFGKDDLLQGNAFVDLAWSGDALYAVEESWNDDLGEEGDYELAYYVPNGAGNIWFDGWVVPDCCNPDHMNAIKLFINFLNQPRVAAENMLEIGYTSALDPQAVMDDIEARRALAEGYAVYAPELWDDNDNKNPISADDCDYDSWDEFEEYFFAYCDEIDGCNWRYPFLTEQDGNYNRALDTLGVMRDFGDKNHDVVTMWNYARSAGVSALPLLGWTALGVVAIALIVAAAVGVKAIRRKRVVIRSDDK